MQSLLSTEYSKSLREFLRFAIIVTNLVVFYYFCGLRQDSKFGPKINRENMLWDNIAKTTTGESDPMRFISILDMGALILAIYLSLKQLTFGRPEIDSFREKVILLPQEKKVAIILVFFTIFKTCVQFFHIKKNENLDKSEHFVNSYSRARDVANDRGFLLFAKEITKLSVKEMNSSDKGFFEKNVTLMHNLFLVLSSVMCLVSSLYLKMEIQIAEKRMVLKIVRFFSYLARLGLMSTMIYIMFIGDNKCVCLVFILMLLFDAIRAIYLAVYSKNRNLMDIKDYLMVLKWVSFLMLCLIICGSLFYHIVRLLYYCRNIPDGDSKVCDGYIITIIFKWIKTIPYNLAATILTKMDLVLLFLETDSYAPRIVAYTNPEYHQEHLRPPCLHHRYGVHCQP